MISGTDIRLKKLNTAYRSAFGERIPLMMIPESETIEGLEKKVTDSITAGRNLLPEFYKWDDNVYY